MIIESTIEVNDIAGECFPVKICGSIAYIINNEEYKHKSYYKIINESFQSLTERYNIKYICLEKEQTFEYIGNIEVFPLKDLHKILKTNKFNNNFEELIK